MENNEVRAGQITIYLLIGLSSILVLIDIIEVFQLINVWEKSLSLSKEIFNVCLKGELIFRTASTCLSICAALAALLMSLGVLFHTFGYAIKDFFYILFYYLYMIFGAIMLSLCISSFFYFNDIFHFCEKSALSKSSNLNDTKVFATGNFITVLGSFILSFIIICFVMSSNVSQFFMTSYHKKYGGSELYRKVFWAILVKKKNPRDLMQEAVNANAEIEEQNAQVII